MRRLLVVMALLTSCGCSPYYGLDASDQVHGGTTMRNPVFLCGTKTVNGVTSRFNLGIDDRLDLELSGVVEIHVVRQDTPCK